VVLNTFIAGAIIGGWRWHMFGHEGVNGFNTHSLLVVTAGTIVFLIAYRAVRGTV
jgi:uncharacterized membrane protein YeaQ/YmgE (transglycosylase-associated protein family)